MNEHDEHVHEWRRDKARQRMSASLADPGFRYESSANTSVARTFARVRRRMRREEVQQQACESATPQIIHLPYRAAK